MRAALCFEAGPELGLGHAHRSLSLARALKLEGADPVVLTASAEIVTSLAPPCPVIALDDVSPVSLISSAGGAQLMILDYFQPEPGFVAAVRAGLPGATLALIGNREPEGVADLIIGQSITPGAPCKGRIDGPAHLLLKPQFQPRRRRSPVREPRRALVCLGGGRPRGLTRLLKLIDTHAPASLLSITVIGAGADRALPQRTARTFEAVDRVDDMAAAMMAADIGFIAGGGLVYEAAACGLPALYCPVVDHQHDLVLRAEAAGIGRVAGRPETVAERDFADRLVAFITDAEARAAMTRAGQSIVDGRGARRVAAALTALRLRAQD